MWLLTARGKRWRTRPCWFDFFRADTILEAVYRKADASDRYRASFYPGPHKFDLEMQAEGFAWFDRWLKA